MFFGSQAKSLATMIPIAGHGAVVSEFPPGTRPLREHFPARNRIVAALSLGTLVVEAALRSGALITARLAADAGREVFAIPGSLHNPMARGCHRLIREGAALVESPDEVIATGERFLGLRYLWAGVSAWGFDCSGYTYTLFHHHGISIARDAGDQMNHSGLAEVAREDLRRGDLVFFATEPGGDSIRHVALYLGDDLIMQAPNAARSVEIMSLTEYDPTGEYAGARRVIDA